MTQPFLSTGIIITREQAEEWNNLDLVGRSALVTSAGVFVPGMGKGGLYMAAGHITAGRLLAEVFPGLMRLENIVTYDAPNVVPDVEYVLIKSDS